MSDKPDISLDNPFWVADWKVEPNLGRLSRGKNSVKVEPKVMTVLICLAQEAGNVISREQLEAAAWEGMVVGYDSLASTIIKLRKAFEDDSKNPRIIETVPKRGYRLIAPVNLAEPIPTETDSSVTPSEPANAGIAAETLEVPESDAPSPLRDLVRSVSQIPISNKIKGLLIVPLYLIVLAAIGYFGLVRPADENQLPTVAVLPFKNISDDPQQEYFSDGMTADLITDLSKLSALSVIARNTVFSYRHEDVDVRKVAQELGAQYVVEGSVRKVGNTVRISARLIDAKNGHNLWADRFDGAMDNVFVLQDRVTSRIVESLEVRLSENERSQIVHKYTNSAEAYDHFLQGWQYFWNMSREGNQIARESYLKAIKLDPKFARAYANLALTYAYEHLNGWSEDPEQTIKQANSYASKAVELDNKLPQVYWALAVVQTYSRQYKDALESTRTALVLDHNYADGYGLLATVLNYAGQPKKALEAMDKAFQLNPRHPTIYRIMRGEMYFNMHDYNNAVRDFTYALQSNPEAQEPRLWLAATYVYSGRLDDAKWEIDQLLFADPGLTLARFEQSIPLKDPIQRKHLIDGLYRAGLR